MRAATVGYVAAGAPLLGALRLADAASDGVELSSVQFLAARVLVARAQEEEDERQRERKAVEEVRQDEQAKTEAKKLEDVRVTEKLIAEAKERRMRGSKSRSATTSRSPPQNARSGGDGRALPPPLRRPPVRRRGGERERKEGEKGQGNRGASRAAGFGAAC